MSTLHGAEPRANAGISHTCMAASLATRAWLPALPQCTSLSIAWSALMGSAVAANESTDTNTEGQICWQCWPVQPEARLAGSFVCVHDRVPCMLAGCRDTFSPCCSCSLPLQQSVIDLPSNCPGLPILVLRKIAHSRQAGVGCEVRFCRQSWHTEAPC